ncbi:hypothetical protein RRG08_024633 [Elysia crispata]|uniref:Uncharacterized protein n=1 Tax=Elysia crispata TaxID=231223 RepID=A0AAE0ZWA9_9GAST|nr:hypothetical protein RRG08_024633 [Elysia crispata]
MEHNHLARAMKLVKHNLTPAATQAWIMVHGRTTERRPGLRHTDSTVDGAWFDLGRRFLVRSGQGFPTSKAFPPTCNTRPKSDVNSASRYFYTLRQKHAVWLVGQSQTVGL